jgi:DNA processing protein
LKVDLTENELAAIYALSDVPKIGIHRLRSLITKFTHASAIFDLSLRELIEVEGIHRNLAELILQSGISQEHLSKARRVREKELTILHILNYNYPDKLREIPDAPVLLYSAGEFLPEDEQSIAIVGTRSSTRYGHDMTKNLCAELVKNGFTIVSGLARGIDTEAHRAALESGGRTLAVLGSGLDNIYPQENTKLAREIAGRGVVCTEYYLGTQPDATNFPERNRIISGLSAGTVVVEAGNKSGAILTALIALEQNREVFAVPGRITDKNSVGANRLIKHGAKLVQGVDDILEELVGQFKFKTQKPETKKPRPKLSSAEEKIYELLSHEPLHIDALAHSLDQSTAAVLNTLLGMELRDIVQQLPGKNFKLS